MHYPNEPRGKMKKFNLNESEKIIVADALLEYFHERIKKGNNDSWKALINNLIVEVKK